MPPKVKSGAEQWGPIILSVATLLGGVIHAATLPGRFESLECKIDAMARRLDYVERDRDLMRQQAIVERYRERPDVSTSRDMTPNREERP